MQAGKGSATLSMAYAAAKFAESCLKALQGEPGVIECAYVSSHLTELPFFASPLRLDENGIAVTLLFDCIGHDA
jgi:malate dehydrogenase